ncbi:Permease of the major facilitator superfamily [Phaffia rhodozyma]|uniref:Permease of the major facilitator superfamily n=1 Tax=Phaffia rhodozyma TaxID=264483 RepID=A0A0F7SW73_PHARH|nr:Permease of the major facilitator superfamily [Phaffia rhodozyma]
MLQQDLSDLVRALDRRILYPIILAYTCSYIDRSNISNSLTSLERSIGLSPERYALSAALFTVSLVIIEVPSNLLVKKLGPKKWLSVLVAGCGLCTIFQACAPNYQSLIVIRTILGAFEGGVFPGFLYALTVFYPPKNLTVRISSFTLAASVAFSLGSFLAGLFLPISNGPFGLEGWQLLFLLQGILTVSVAGSIWTFIPSDNHSIYFLRPHLKTLYDSIKHDPLYPPPDERNVSRSASPRPSVSSSILPTSSGSYPPIPLPVTVTAPGRSLSRSPPSSDSHRPKQLPRIRSDSSTPLITSPPATVISSSTLKTLIDPFTITLAAGYMLLLLATTPSAFLPRILQARYGLTERSSNVLVGTVYVTGGFVQFAVGWWAGRSGVRTVWRTVATGVISIWLLVGLWEAIIMRGSFVFDTPHHPQSGTRFGHSWPDGLEGIVGIALRLLATLATPCLGSLFLAHTVSVPVVLVPQSGTLMAGVIAVGNLAQAIGPVLYASCIPPLSRSPSPLPIPIPPTTHISRVISHHNFNPSASTTATVSSTYTFWAELATRDLLMGLSVLGSWVLFELVARWVERCVEERFARRLDVWSSRSLPVDAR